jgi:magnesium transporter
MLTIRRLHGGRVEELAQDALAEAVSARDGVVWVDLAAPTADETGVLAVLGLSDAAICGILDDVHHPRVLQAEDGLLELVVHGVDLDLAAFAFSTRELDVVVGDRWLVTHAPQPVDAVEVVARRLAASPRLAGSAYRLLYEVIDTLIDVYLPFLELIDQRIDAIETLIFADRPDPAARNEIYYLRRDVITLRRIAVPQAEALGDLARRLRDEGHPQEARAFADLRDKLTRMAGLTDSYREVLDSALDQYQSAVANAQNEVMKVLTMVSAVLLPITVVTGIYGMNFAYMPELDERWAYPAVLTLNVLIVVTVLSIFRVRGWLGRRQRGPRELMRELHVPAVGRVLQIPAVGVRTVTALARRRR